MDVFGLAVLFLTGFTACAEFGSYAFVHPVVRRLPPAQMIAFEQGLLRTFGRAYPILMPLSGLMLIGHAVWPNGEGGPSVWRWLAVIAWFTATLTTLIVNVPINVVTAKWNPRRPERSRYPVMIAAWSGGSEAFHQRSPPFARAASSVAASMSVKVAMSILSINGPVNRPSGPPLGTYRPSSHVVTVSSMLPTGFSST